PARRAGERIGRRAAAGYRGAALQAVPGELGELRLRAVGGMEAVTAGDVAARELVVERADSELQLVVGSLDGTGGRRAAGGNLDVFRGDALEDLVVADQRVVHVDAPLVRAVRGERRADVERPPQRAAVRAEARATAGLRPEVAELRD